MLKPLTIEGKTIESTHHEVFICCWNTN